MERLSIFPLDCLAVVITDTEVAYGPFHSTGDQDNVHDFIERVADEVNAGPRPVSTRAAQRPQPSATESLQERVERDHSSHRGRHRHARAFRDG
jgi:hypothetical protein